MGNLIEIESIAGTAGVSWDTPAKAVPLETMRRVMSNIGYEGKPGRAPAMEMEAEINGTTFAARAYRDGGVDLAQPQAGTVRRRKKMLYIDSVDDLLLFLQNVQTRAREYYGSDWGKEA